MKALYFILLILSAEFCSAQIERTYITASGNYTDDQKQAISYILIQRLNDTVYATNQYNMHDTITCSGYYKDQQLTIPNGKFLYYAKIHPKYPFATDTNNFVQMSGYFINGKREGLWIIYDLPHIRAAEYTFENGKLNGPFKKYFNDFSGLWAEGQMVNNMQEGKFKIYNADSLLVQESDYKHNKEFNPILHFHKALPPDNQVAILERILKKYKDELNAAKDAPFIKFTVTINGDVNKVEIVKSFNPEIDSAVIAAIKQIKYTPANYDGTVCEQKILMPVYLFNKMNVESAPLKPLAPHGLLNDLGKKY